jgi:hypothetical protein
MFKPTKKAGLNFASSMIKDEKSKIGDQKTQFVTEVKEEDEESKNRINKQKDIKKTSNANLTQIHIPQSPYMTSMR